MLPRLKRRKTLSRCGFVCGVDSARYTKSVVTMMFQTPADRIPFRCPVLVQPASSICFGGSALRSSACVQLHLPRGIDKHLYSNMYIALTVFMVPEFSLRPQIGSCLVGSWPPKSPPVGTLCVDLVQIARVEFSSKTVSMCLFGDAANRSLARAGLARCPAGAGRGRSKWSGPGRVCVAVVWNAFCNFIQTCDFTNHVS